MEIRRNKYALVVGVFVVLALAIFAVAILTLGGEKQTFTKKIPVKIVFDDINGLKEGNNIWFSGVKIGTIKKIDLKGFAKVEVTLNIDDKARMFIHKDATAKIGSDGLLGSKIVVIYEGSPDQPPIEANDYLHVQLVKHEDDLMALLKSNGKNLLEITDNFKSISKKIADGEGTVGKLISDHAMANTLQGTLDDFKVISTNSKKVVSNIQTLTDRLNAQQSSINKLIADTTLYDSIKTAVTQISKLTTTANDFANKMDDFAQNLKTASNGLKDSTNTAGKILNDKDMATYMESTMKNLESASKKLDQDLEAMQHNFLLRKYFKTKAKEKPAESDTTGH